MSTAAIAILCGMMSAQIDSTPDATTGQSGLVQTDPSRDRARREPAPDTGLLYHLTWYGADYAVTGALLGASFGLLPILKPGPALYGPRFDDDNPDLVSLNQPAYSRLLGKPFQEDTVPNSWLYIGIGTLAATSMTYDTLRHRDWHRTHNLFLGAAESLALAFFTTEALKRGVGRLRPDFRDRANRYYCNPELGRRDLAGLNCSAADADGVYIDEKELDNGHESFPSGHAMSSFALATYFALYVGGETVWGDHANSWSTPAGAAIMAGLFGTAATVAATRISDGRHHPDDVAAGAAIGAASSALFYFLHFDTRGRATYRGLSITPVALQEGMALSLAWAI